MRFTYDLSLDWVNYFIYSTPLVTVFGLSSYDAEALKDIDYVINTPSFYSEFSSALIKQQKVFLWLSVNT